MVARRLERVSRLIRSTVSEIIQHELSDPRVSGMISVTRVESSPDLRTAKVYLTISGVSDEKAELSLRGIRHASGFVRTRLASRLAMKSCPALKIYLDKQTKIGIETVDIIDGLFDEEKENSESMDDDDELKVDEEGVRGSDAK